MLFLVIAFTTYLGVETGFYPGKRAQRDSSIQHQTVFLASHLTPHTSHLTPHTSYLKPQTVFSIKRHRLNLNPGKALLIKPQLFCST